MLITCFPDKFTPVGPTEPIEDLEQFHAHLLRNGQPAGIKDPAGFAVATFRENHRRKSNYLASTGFVALDFEGTAGRELTADELAENILKLADYGYIFYSSRSSGLPGKGARGRLIIQVSPVPQSLAEHEGLIKSIFRLFPEGTYDNKCFDASRLFFYPPDHVDPCYVPGPLYIWDPQALPKENERACNVRPEDQQVPDEDLEDFVEALIPRIQAADSNRNNLSMCVLGAFAQAGLGTEKAWHYYEQVFAGFDEHLDNFPGLWERSCDEGTIKVWGRPTEELFGEDPHKADGLYELFGKQLGSELRSKMRPGALPPTGSEVRNFPSPAGAYRDVPGVRLIDAAEAFLAVHFPEQYPLRYHQGIWYHYDGACYQEAEVERLETLCYHYLKLARGFAVITKNDQPETISVSFYKDKMLAHLREFLGHLQALVTTHSPPRTDLTCVVNGILDPRTNRMIPHDPKHFVVGCRPWSFLSESEPTPELDRFYDLCEFDANQRLAHLEALGYACFGRPQDVHAWVLLVGPARAGKGTTGELIKLVVGPQNVASLSFSDLGEQFGLEDAVNKQVLYFDDVKFQVDNRYASRSKIVERLLSMSTGTEISINRKGVKKFSTSLGMVVACSNDIPTMGGGAPMTARMHVVPFTKSHVGKEDRGLLERLTEELDAIARRAWDAWQGVLARGRRFTSAGELSREILEEVAIGGSSVARFVSEQLDIDPKARTYQTEIYRDYQNWCEECGYKNPATAHTFYDELKRNHNVVSAKVRGTRCLGARLVKP